MRTSARIIGLAAIGLLLSTGLQGCGTDAKPATPTAVAVAIRSDPPAELTTCATRPAPLPEDQIGILPSALRLALIAFAQAFAGNAAQLDRLIEWERPGSCAPTSK